MPCTTEARVTPRPTPFRSRARWSRATVWSACRSSAGSPPATAPRGVVSLEPPRDSSRGSWRSPPSSRSRRARIARVRSRLWGKPRAPRRGGLDVRVARPRGDRGRHVLRLRPVRVVAVQRAGGLRVHARPPGRRRARGENNTRAVHVPRVAPRAAARRPAPRGNTRGRGPAGRDRLAGGREPLRGEVRVARHARGVTRRGRLGGDGRMVGGKGRGREGRPPSSPRRGVACARCAPRLQRKQRKQRNSCSCCPRSGCSAKKTSRRICG